MITATANRLDRLDELAKTRGLDGFLFTSPASVKNYSGYYYNFETGPSPFHLLPAVFVVLPGGIKQLVLADNEKDRINGLHPGVAVIPYSSYTYETPLRFTGDFMLRLLEVIAGNGAAHAQLGIEMNVFPLSLYQVMQERFPGIRFTDVSDDLVFLRAVKDDDEVACIRKAASLADAGQDAVIKHAREGITESELFSNVRFAMETMAGGRIPVMTDLVSGKTTATGGGNPVNKTIGKNELLLCDLTPCLDGYWGDSCNTIVVGTPTAEQRRVYLKVKEALEMGIAAVRPGAVAMDIDLVMRRYLEREGGFGHHGGHGVGTVYHEEPRIVPYNTMVLQPGMVIALEPAVYKEDYGIRLEHLMVVTKDGCELLTRFNHCFEPF